MSEETIIISRVEYEELMQENARLAKAVISLQEQLILSNKRRFGRSSEQSKYDNGNEQMKGTGTDFQRSGSRF